MKQLVALSTEHFPHLVFTRAGELFLLHKIHGFEKRLYDDGTTETLGIVDRRVGWKLGGTGKPGGDGGEPIPTANDVVARAA